MMKKRSIVAGLVSAVAALLGCSSSNNNSHGGSVNSSDGADVACLSMSSTPMAACQSCAESACGSLLNAAVSGCSDWIGCACPGGTFSTTGAFTMACQNALTEASCICAQESFFDCSNQNCMIPCGNTMIGSSTQCGGSSDSGVGFAPGTSTASCYIPVSMTCSSLKVTPSEAAAIQQACANDKGTPGSECPTSGLAGCCTMGTTEDCYYNASEAMSAESACTGTWSTTP
jgi:hypothetical protein